LEVVVEAGGVLAEEFVVEDLFSLGFPFLPEFGDGPQQGVVAVGFDLQVLGGKGGGLSKQSGDFLWVGKGDEARFFEWVDGDDLGAIFSGFFQGTQHAGVIGPRVLSHADDGVGGVEIVERDGSFADADGSRHGGATGFVAHVGAVGEVVGAVMANHQLVEEGGFVAGAPGGVEDGFVRIVERVEFGGDELEGILPTDGLVMGGAWGFDDRLSEATLLLVPSVGLIEQCGNGVLGEELSCDRALGRFGGDGLGAILAKLCDGAVLVRVGPGTTGAVETLFLVELEERFGASDGAGLSQNVFQRGSDRRGAGGPLFG